MILKSLFHPFLLLIINIQKSPENSKKQPKSSTYDQNFRDSGWYAWGYPPDRIGGSMGVGGMIYSLGSAHLRWLYEHGQ